MIEQFTIGRVENDMNSIGLGSVWQCLAGKDNGIPGISDLGPLLATGLGLVSNLRVYKGAGIL